MGDLLSTPAAIDLAFQMNAPDTGFAEALRDADREKLRAFPRTDRHCHSLLGANL